MKPDVTRDKILVFRDVLAQDKVMKSLLQYEPPPSRLGQTSLFVSIVRAIISQQLSNAAASTIFTRLKNLADMDAEIMSKLDLDTFKTCGVSASKAGYIKAVSSAVTDGYLDGIANLSDEEAIGKLVKLKGVGKWTAEMILIFALGREDVWPSDDAGLLRAAKKLYDIQDKLAFIALGDRFRPFRSYAALYLWHALENQN